MKKQPHPISISGMELPESLQPIFEAMSENVCHQWDESKNVDRNHCFERNVNLKTNTCLFPYHLFPENDNEYYEYFINTTVSTAISDSLNRKYY